jgi:hypothetical protein
MNMLQGKKTYMVALGIVLAAAGGFFAGELTVQEAIVQALTGLGLGALRMGVKADAGGGQ